MKARRALPVAIGAAIFVALAVVVAVLLSRAKDDEYFIVKAAQQLAVERYDAQRLQPGVDYRLDTLKILSRDELHAVVRVAVVRPAGSDFLYWEMMRSGEAWALGRDLHEHFAGFVKSEGSQEAMGERFKTATADRYRASIDINTASFRFILSDQEPDVVATTDFLFKAGATQARYVETWRYRGREWKVDGQGRIFEGVGR